MLGTQQKLVTTSSRHYDVSLTESQNVASRRRKSNICCKDCRQLSWKKISQEATFTVFLPEKLLKLFCIAGMDSDEDLKNAISTISDKCKICEIDHRPRFKPVVSVSL